MIFFGLFLCDTIAAGIEARDGFLSWSKWYLLDRWSKPSCKFWLHFLFCFYNCQYFPFLIDTFIRDCVSLLPGPYYDAITDKTRKWWNSLSHSSVPFILCFHWSPWGHTGMLLICSTLFRSSRLVVFNY